MYQRRPNIRWTQTGAPSFEPLTLAQAKAHLRVDVSDEDALISSLISAARIYVEGRTGRVLPQRTYAFEVNGFPIDAGDIVLPLAPCKSVDSITYYDPTGAMQTLALAQYRSNVLLSPPRIRSAVLATAWPETAYADDAVTITATMGYSSEAAIPENAKHACRLLVGHWYENREAVVTGTISSDVGMTVDALLGLMHTGEVMP